MTTSRVSMFFLLFPLFTGCASSSAQDSDAGAMASGTAPKISNLVLSPTTVGVGKLETVSGNFAFEDPDGDVSQLAITLKTGGQSSAVPKSDLANTAGVTSGKALAAIALQVPQAGPVEVHLTVTDKAGHTSNELVVTLTAQ